MVLYRGTIVRPIQSVTMGRNFSADLSQLHGVVLESQMERRRRIHPVFHYAVPESDKFYLVKFESKDLDALCVRNPRLRSLGNPILFHEEGLKVIGVQTTLEKALKSATQTYLLSNEETECDRVIGKYIHTQQPDHYELKRLYFTMGRLIDPGDLVSFMSSAGSQKAPDENWFVHDCQFFYNGQKQSSDPDAVGQPWQVVSADVKQVIDVVNGLATIKIHGENRKEETLRLRFDVRIQRHLSVQDTLS